MQPQTIAINIVSFRIIEFLRKSARSPAFRPQEPDAHPFRDAKRFRLKAGLRTALSLFQGVGGAKVRVIGDVEEIRPKLQTEHGLS
jgi:hypothetical protein